MIEQINKALKNSIMSIGWIRASCIGFKSLTGQATVANIWLVNRCLGAGFSSFSAGWHWSKFDVFKTQKNMIAAQETWNYLTLCNNNRF